MFHKSDENQITKCVTVTQNYKSMASTVTIKLSCENNELLTTEVLWR